jgi:ABC-type amino acid transport substrate-binding protein
MLAGIGVTRERSQKVSFISPVIRTGGALFSATGSRTTPGRIVTPAAGPLTGATQRAFPECTIIGVDDYAQALAAVVDGHADAAALNLHVGSVIAKRNHHGWFDIPTEPFHVINLAPAFAPDRHPDLRQALDTLIGSAPDQDESR